MKNNAELVEYLINNGFLHTENLIFAFKNTDRMDFVVPENRQEAYNDYPLPILEKMTISQPSTVAFMLENLGPNSGDQVLDIGSGSGWTTALLAQAVGYGGEVIGLEIKPELVKYGQENLAKYDLPNAKILPAINELGAPGQVFDKILVSAAANTMPEQLFEQLKIGGILVIPVKDSIWKITRLDEENFKEEKFYGFSFVPLIQ